MPDFSPYLIARTETIGDSRSSSDYNLILPPASPSDHDVQSTNIVSKTVIYVLEFLLMIIMMPITLCQRVYENDHLMVMMRVILEVTLELIMWLVLAGVSILTSAALIFDDLYSGKSGSEGYRRLVKNCNEERIGADDRSRDDEMTEETNHNMNSPSCQKDEVHNSEENIPTLESNSTERDEFQPVNFSFYKPIRHRSMPEDKRKMTDDRCVRKF